MMNLPYRTALVLLLSQWLMGYKNVWAQGTDDDDNGGDDGKVRYVIERPVIGALAMAITDKTVHKYWPYSANLSYLAGSYVKLIEGSGGRVAPISDRFNEDNLTHIFYRISGLLLPGGEINLEDSHYYEAAKYLFKLAIKVNQNGTYFPILGICRGAQAMPVFVADTLDVLEDTASKNVSLAVKLSKDYKKSKMLEDLPDSVKDSLEKQKLTAHFHKYGMDPKVFNTNSKLKKFFRVLGTSKDKNGKEFVSLFEAKDFPFYGIQFHPEKSMYEWHPFKDIRHTPDAIRLGQYFANFFVDEVRRNTVHRFANINEEISWNVERYPITYTAVNTESETPFETIYMM